jgi:proteasome lid subunit RPN8/RPN11
VVTIKLNQGQYQQIVDQAQAGFPNEICGILAGAKGQVVDVYPAKNVAATPRIRFSMAPEDILAITDKIDSADQELVAFYHSHTHTQAYPSPTDVADWPARWYPDALLMICSLMEPDRPSLRAFQVNESGEITEATVEISG